MGENPYNQVITRAASAGIPGFRLAEAADRYGAFQYTYVLDTRDSERRMFVLVAVAETAPNASVRCEVSAGAEAGPRFGRWRIAEFELPDELRLRYDWTRAEAAVKDLAAILHRAGA